MSREQTATTARAAAAGPRAAGEAKGAKEAGEERQ